MRRLIADSGLSQYRIAIDCGIDRGLMSRFMNGKSNISLRQLERLADYLGWTIVAKSKSKTKGR